MAPRHSSFTQHRRRLLTVSIARFGTIGNLIELREHSLWSPYMFRRKLVEFRIRIEYGVILRKRNYGNRRRLDSGS
jgi:hypothetical protein